MPVPTEAVYWHMSELTTITRLDLEDHDRLHWGIKYAEGLIGVTGKTVEVRFPFLLIKKAPVTHSPMPDIRTKAREAGVFFSGLFPNEEMINYV